MTVKVTGRCTRTTSPATNAPTPSPTFTRVNWSENARTWTAGSAISWARRVFTAVATPAWPSPTRTRGATADGTPWTVVKSALPRAEVTIAPTPTVRAPKASMSEPVAGVQSRPTTAGRAISRPVSARSTWRTSWR